MRRTLADTPPMDSVTKLRLCDHKITLNGNRASLSGVRNRFATVTDHTTGLSAEWSWEAVRYVINHKEGAFKS